MKTDFGRVPVALTCTKFSRRSKKIEGAQEVVSLELFRPEYYRMNPNDVYRIGKEHADAVIKRNFG